LCDDVLGSRGMSGIPSSSQATLLQHLTSKIRFNGPITVADYMKEVLTNAAGVQYLALILSFVSVFLT